jgi:fructokinase
MTRVVVAGEALIDRVARPDGTVHEVPGGGPFNTARTLARLGVEVVFLGRLSTDAAGVRLRAALAADGVSLDAAVATDDPTTTAIATLAADGSAIYRFELDGTSAAGLSWTDLAAAGLDPARIDVLHIGTLGLVLEPSGTTIERLVGAVGPTTLVMLDPNLRPSATADPVAHRARIDRLARRADVVKVSTDDLRALDADGDRAAGLAGLRSAGPAVVLVTDGDHPVEVLFAGGDGRRVPVPRANVVDTIGAGDAFGGGFLATWVLAGHGRDALADAALVEAAVRTAAVVATMTVERRGAEPPTRAELDARLMAAGAG